MPVAKKPKPRGRRTKVKARRGRTVLPPDRARAAHPLDRLVLDGRKLNMQIGDRLVDATLTRTVEGPNTVTVTVWNGDHVVLQSGLLGERAMSRVVRIELDGLGFVATGVSKQGDQLTVTFEDARVATLKRHGRGKPLRASRGETTRAHFCAGMIRHAGVPVLILDEDVIQPIAGRKQLKAELAKARRDRTRSRRARAKGQHVVSGKGLTVKGVAATSEQRRVMATALSVAADEKAPPKATVALLAALIVESTARNLTYGDATSTGVLQLLSSTAAALHVSARDVTAVCRLFLRDGFAKYHPRGAIELARQNPTWTPGQVAQACQGSAYPSRYDEYRAEAERWLAGAKGIDLPDLPGVAWTKEVQFERRRTESTWAACWRLLVEEVGWRLFIREGVVVIASDPALMRAKPALEVSARSDAVEDIDFEWHAAARVHEATARAYVGRWDADPGEVIAVEGFGPIDRNWLLASTSVSLVEPDPQLAELALRAPQRPKAEPKPEVETAGAASGRSGAGDDTVVSGDKGTAQRLYAECKRISDAGGPYVYGGGHGPALSSLSSGQGLDCSSSTSLALFRAGLFRPSVAWVSGAFVSGWGAPGHGRFFTVWAKAGSTTGHVWIEFHGFPMRRFDTSPHGDGPPGPRLRGSARSTFGFTARHYPGL